jgi:hypothetical protein
MHTCGRTHKKDLSYFKSHALNLGIRIGVAILSLWVWVEVEGLRACWTCIPELRGCSFPLLDSRFVLTLESHISLD